jgi:cell surface protein SprA
MKIDLRADYNDSRNTEIQYMFAGMPETRSGIFSISTIGLGGFFAKTGNARNEYRSEVFLKMLANRDIITSRFQNSYFGQQYPDKGFLSGTIYANKDFNPNLNQSGLKNSSDVLIPAFIAAYTNRNVNKIALTAFPSLKTILPNWTVTYDGLIQIPIVRKYFKSVNLSHKYTGKYNVSSYTSYLNWVNAGIGGDLGYVRNTETGAPVPSMGYEIASVTLLDMFDPLFEVNATLLNDITAKAKISKTRTTNMNVTSYQLVEMMKNDVTVGIGYKYAEFNKILKLKKKGDFSNDLKVSLDYTYGKGLSLIRKLEDGFTQATQGTIIQNFKFMADYAYSRKVTLRAFYDLQINKPLVSSSSYPTSNSNYGVSIQITLNNE